MSDMKTAMHRIQVVAQRAYMVLNGVVNTQNPASGLIISDYKDISSIVKGVSETDMASNVGFGNACLVAIIRDTMAKHMLSNYEPEDWDIYIVVVVTHELLHCDQRADGLKYASDPQYRHDVERDTQMLTFRFLSNYKEWIEDRIGVSIDLDKVEAIIDPAYLPANFMKAVKERCIPWSHWY